jgi:hypothetical protein
MTRLSFLAKHASSPSRSGRVLSDKIQTGMARGFLEILGSDSFRARFFE